MHESADNLKARFRVRLFSLGPKKELAPHFGSILVARKAFGEKGDLLLPRKSESWLPHKTPT